MKNNKGKWIGLAVAAIAFGVIGFTNVDARDHHHKKHYDGGRVAVEIVRAIFAPQTLAPKVYVAPPPPPPKVVVHHHHRRPAPPPPRRHHHGGRGRR